jgi:deazaflavin-dependent oxidoreductase (nitroreductase family)
MEEYNGPRGWRLFVQRIVSVTWVTDFVSHFIFYLDRLCLQASKGRFSLSGFIAGWLVINVTTIGARSGLSRTLPLLGIQEGEKFILIASNFGRPHHPGWYYNLKANPEATLSFQGRTGKFLAHEASGEERQHYWQLATQTYIGFPLYEQRAGGRHIPVMVLTPQEY